MKNLQKRSSSPPVLVTFAVSLLVSYSFAGRASAAKYATWSDPTSERFNHMAVDDSTGQVYIAAVNRVYQLDGDLNLKAFAVMGPQDDSPNCPATKICPKVSKKPTDYFNKVLLIDSSGRQLISCGSLFQGRCNVHDLNNVAIYGSPSSEAVVANNDNASTAAFIAPGPGNRTSVLYVGVSYTGNGPYSVDVPAVSSRSLDPSDMLAFSSDSLIFGTRISVNSLWRAEYPITYISGFSSEGFSYFVTVQKQSVNPSSPFISKLVRVCQNDADYYSYTEVALVCKTPHGTDYNLAQAAYVGRPGSELAKSMGIPNQESVLFAVFAKSRDEAGMYNEPSQNSALCVYSLSAVRRKFKQNIQQCFSGIGERGLDFIIPSQRCHATQLQIEDGFCGAEINAPLDGTLPVQAAPVLLAPGTLVTAVAGTSVDDYYTVTFLGTSTGHLKKVVVETATAATEYSDVVIDEGSPVNADIVFDEMENYLYVMTERRVTKVKVQDCDVFQTCRDCVTAHDPYCGWCFLEKKCLSRKACSETGHDSKIWLSYKSKQCYVFTEVQLSVASDKREETETVEGHTELPGNGVKKEGESKLQALQDIAQSMRNIDISLKELIQLHKHRK